MTAIALGTWDHGGQHILHRLPVPSEGVDEVDATTISKAYTDDLRRLAL